MVIWIGIAAVLKTKVILSEKLVTSLKCLRVFSMNHIVPSKVESEPDWCNDLSKVKIES